MQTRVVEVAPEWGAMPSRSEEPRASEKLASSCRQEKFSKSGGLECETDASGGPKTQKTARGQVARKKAPCTARLLKSRESSLSLFLVLQLRRAATSSPALWIANGPAKASSKTAESALRSDSDSSPRLEQVLPLLQDLRCGDHVPEAPQGAGGGAIAIHPHFSVRAV